jgi:hypothetical protein
MNPPSAIVFGFGFLMLFTGTVTALPPAPPLPPAVIAIVKQNAAKRHPTDLSLQVYEMDSQFNAYDVLSHYESLGAHGVPAGVMTQIITKAKAKHSTNFSLVVYEIQSEVAAFRHK